MLHLSTLYTSTSPHPLSLSVILLPHFFITQDQTHKDTYMARHMLVTCKHGHTQSHMHTAVKMGVNNLPYTLYFANGNHMHMVNTVKPSELSSNQWVRNVSSHDTGQQTWHWKHLIQRFFNWSRQMKNTVKLIWLKMHLVTILHMLFKEQIFAIYSQGNTRAIYTCMQICHWYCTWMVTKTSQASSIIKNEASMPTHAILLYSMCNRLQLITHTVK